MFFVHNNISTMISIKAFLSRLLPGVTVVVAHSKVGQKESHLRRFLVGRSSWRDVLGAQQEVVESMAARIDASGAVCLASISLSLLAGGTDELR